jgi:GNAT superfamily N-acetyltransferase
MSDKYSIQIFEHPELSDVELHQSKVNTFSGQTSGSKDYYLFLKNEINQIHAGVKVTKNYDFLVLESIWVDDDLQRQGYGSKLYFEVEAFARRQGCRKILLSTFDFMQSLLFWKRVGFQIAGQIPDCPKGNILYYLYKPLGS